MKSQNTKSANANTTDAVDRFVAQLEHPRTAEIQAIRGIILGADSRIQESIKWNAPSFFIAEHFATMKLRPAETVQVVFHTGAKVKAAPAAITISDPLGLLQWVAQDRCIATFTDINDVVAKRDALRSIVQQWIEQM